MVLIMEYAETDILQFLYNVDADFNPPLSSKVVLNEYVSKIISKAELIVRGDSGGIFGMVILYANDICSRSAYISLVGVKSTYRGRGVATDMMREAIAIAKDKGMARIGIHSNNNIAIELYKSIGFVVKTDDERKYMEYEIK